ncbi:MAG TPA: hypothetical protein VKB04_15110, partial [Anaerolineales bacterium]|nr:hypothetical protein [Anaerolineales bacterium]
MLSDSFFVLMDHWRLVAGILLIILLGQIVIWSMLRMIFSDQLTSDEYYSISLAGWMLPIFMASVLWLSLKFFERLEVSALLVLFLIALLAILLVLRIRKGLLPDSRTTLSILLALSVLFIFLRLAFISKTAIPLYFDSAQHYLVIQNLVENPASNAITLFTRPSTAYYHIGYHIVAAFTASVLHADIIPVMLVLG